MKTVNQLYNELKAKLDTEYLKNRCSGIIELYRNKQYGDLRKYIRLNNFDPAISNERLFALLMKMFFGCS